MQTWVFFNLFILAILASELFIFRRKARIISLKEALYMSAFSILLALSFNVYIYFSRGNEAAINFLTGYLIEKSLSVDNLFVFLLIFTYFRTPLPSLHKVLFFGVVGAIAMRAIFIWLGLVLVGYFHWLIYIFGAFLVFSGIKFGLGKDKKIFPEKNFLLKGFRYFFPVTDTYEKDKFFVLKQSRYFATPLFIVLLSIETTDVIFAVDSIPAVLSITFDPFIVYSSNIFALLGLRSLYFVLSRMIPLFHYLHYAISSILVFIGMKMLFTHVLPINNLIALGVVFITLTISIAASLLFPKKLR